MRRLTQISILAACLGFLGCASSESGSDMDSMSSTEPTGTQNQGAASGTTTGGFLTDEYFRDAQITVIQGQP